MRKASFLFLISLPFILFTFTLALAGRIVQHDSPKVRLSIPPGATKAGVIQIYNNSSEDKQIKVYLEDWLYLPPYDGTKEFKPAGTTPLSAAGWINFAPAEITVPAYGKQVLHYTVRIPSDAKGGHYAVLFFEDSFGAGKPAAGPVSVSLAVRVASLFYIEPQGTIDRSAKIEDPKITKKDNIFNISAKFSNIGNVDISAKGTFFIIDQKGLPYTRGQFNPIGTLPGDSTTLTSSWKEPIPKGKYDLVLTIDIGKAIEDAGWGRGPVITKEAEIEIDENGEVVRVGELK